MALYQLTEIWIYPVKSLAGIRLESAEVRGKGLRFDRRWMLLDSRGQAMTQREFPQMALLKTSVDAGKMSLTCKSADGQVSWSLNQQPSDRSGLMTDVWGDPVQVNEVDPAVSAWFTLQLQVKCQLVFFPEDNPRPVDPDYSLRGEHVSLADAFPFLIIGQASLDDLNQRLAEPVPMNRFRPNFVFSGGRPFDEDGWKTLQIGDIPFAARKKSSRCVLTTVNQETAAKGPEPLRTLSSYRKSDNKVYFGQNLVSLAEGVVHTGAVIEPDK